ALAVLLSAPAAVSSGSSPASASVASPPRHLGPRAPSPSLSWRTCDTHFRCASLTVPVDYAAPSKGHLRLAVVELPSTSAHPVGDLVMNPGGPGASGVQFLEQTTFPAALRRSFDLVSFDPRGVGASDPVECVGAAGIRRLVALDPAPTTPAEIASVSSALRSFVASCRAHTSKLLLENVGSAVTVEDMDSLRAALGESKLTYLGFSYGTYLGELYAQRYPTHVRAIVLDGVVDPALSTVEDDAQQAAGFEADLSDFFAWCTTNSACDKMLPTGARPAYERLLGALSSGSDLVAHLKPVYGGTERVTLGVFETAVAGALYSEQTWPILAEALSLALRGDGSILAAIAYSYEGLAANGTYSNQVAANTAIDCVDRPYPTALSTYVRLAAAAAKVAPDFGAGEVWGSLVCRFWPVRPEGTVGPIHAPGSPPILVVGSTGDPATPYAWARSVARQLDHATLLTRDGPGHTAYLFSSCIQRWTNRYLTTLALPPAGTTCASGT
ncbi:MAG: alpha/beta hydrolase, partial [Actinomycetota bacterium]|nr:alpha/beta hydrolase [Actinomycetota bacterium]